MKKIRFISVCFLLLAMCSAFIYSEGSGVKVINTFGRTDIKSAGETQWKSLVKDSLAAVNDTVKTEADSYAEFELSPGNTVRLKENSQLVIKDLEKSSQDPDGSVIKLTDFNLIDGGLALKLDKLPKGSVIQVSSPTAIAGARGTGFSVGYNSQNQSAQVAVVESQVLVASNGDQGKTAMVSQFQKVTVAPWAMATPQVRGGGILSEIILGKPFIETVATPLIQAVGTGDTEEKAKDNACYSLSKIIQGISVSQDKKIEDLLNNDPKLCQPLYNYISKAEVISSRKLENKIEVTVKTELLPIASILNIKLPPMPAIVKPVTMKEYSDKFGAQARVTTQRAAQLDGYRKLAEMMYGVVIKSKTVLQDMAIKDDRITSTVEGVVKGAEIVDTQYYSDGSITVIMAIRADLVRSEVAKVTGDIFGVNFFTSPTVIDINDLIK